MVVEVSSQILGFCQENHSNPCRPAPAPPSGQEKQAENNFLILYPDSGPVDLALKVMVALFAKQDEDEDRYFDSSVSQEAWLLHQHFNFDYLALVDCDSGRIEWETVEPWFSRRTT